MNVKLHLYQANKSSTKYRQVRDSFRIALMVSTGVRIVMPTPGPILTTKQHNWHHRNSSNSDGDTEHDNMSSSNRSVVIDIETGNRNSARWTGSPQTDVHDRLLRPSAEAGAVGVEGPDSPVSSVSNRSPTDQIRRRVTEHHQVGLFELLNRKIQLLLYCYTADLEPFFRDVTTLIIMRRLIYAVLPHTRKANELVKSPDFYGPLMLVLTQTQVLRLGMRHHHIHINEQALIATCLLLCFTYWALLTLALLVFGKVTIAANSKFKASNDIFFPVSTAACIAGYALFGHLIVLLANHLNPVLFYPTFMTVGVGASTCMWVAMVRALRKSPWVSPAAIIIGVLHLAWLWHLRSSYAF